MLRREVSNPLHELNEHKKLNIFPWLRNILELGIVSQIFILRFLYCNAYGIHNVYLNISQRHILWQ